MCILSGCARKRPTGPPSTGPGERGAKNNRDIVQVSPMPHAHTLLRFSLNVGRATSYKSSMSRSGYLLRRGGAGRSRTETGGPAGVLAGVLLAREQGA